MFYNIFEMFLFFFFKEIVGLRITGSSGNKVNTSSEFQVSAIEGGPCSCTFYPGDGAVEEFALDAPGDVTLTHNYTNEGIFNVSAGCENSAKNASTTTSIIAWKNINGSLALEIPSNVTYPPGDATFALTSVSPNETFLGLTCSWTFYDGIEVEDKLARFDGAWNRTHSFDASFVEKMVGGNVVCENFGSEVRLSAAREMRLPRCHRPSVVFPNSTIDQHKNHTRSEYFSVKPDINLDCETSNTVTSKWDIFLIERSGSKVKLSLSFPDSTIAKFLPLSLQYGKYRLEGTFALQGVPGSDVTHFIYFSIIPSDLILHFVGGPEKSIGFGRLATIDALELTVDPDVDPTDKSGMSFSWFCQRQGETLPPIGGALVEIPTPTPPPNQNQTTNGTEDRGGCFGTGAGQLNASSKGIIELDTNLMLKEQSYTFTVVVKKDTRQASAQFQLHIRKGDPPVMTIE